MEEQNKKSLQILAKTWSKDTHGLFDYEIIHELNSNNFTVTGSGSLIRENDEVKNKDLSQVDIDYPIIVKPVDSCGAAGVSKIEDPSELADAVKKACHWSRTNDAIVEEFKKGMEVSVYTFIKNKKAHVVTTSQRISVIDKDMAKCFCAVSPAPISEAIRTKMEDIATSLAEAFDLDNTPLFYQSIVKGDDVFVIEFSPRMGGGLCYRTMQLNAEFEMLDASINSYLGEETVVNPKREDKYFLIHQVHGKDGIFDHLEGYEELIKEGIIKEIFLIRHNGRDKRSAFRLLDDYRTRFDYAFRHLDSLIDLAGIYGIAVDPHFTPCVRDKVEHPVTVLFTDISGEIPYSSVRKLPVMLNVCVLVIRSGKL